MIFSSDFLFSIFSDFAKIQYILYFLFLSLFLCSSIPFLIHYKPSTIPKHKSYYNVYNIYQYSITFHPAIIASVPGFTALQILQPFQMVTQSRRNIPYIILHYAQYNRYIIRCQLCNFNKSQKNQKYFKKSVDNSFNLCYY